MKKYIYLLAVVIGLISSCFTPGETKSYPDITLKFNGKIYKVKTVYISKTEYIHVIYPANPKDSTVTLPFQVIQNEGKNDATPVNVVELN